MPPTAPTHASQLLLEGMMGSGRDPPEGDFREAKSLQGLPDPPREFVGVRMSACRKSFCGMILFRSAPCWRFFFFLCSSPVLPHWQSERGCPPLRQSQIIALFYSVSYTHLTLPTKA